MFCNATNETVIYTDQWGNNHKLALILRHYDNDSSPAIGAYEADEEMGWQPYCSFTVKLEDDENVRRGNNFAFIDENNFPGATAWLENIGIVRRADDEYLGISGFCAYPLVEVEEWWISAAPSIENFTTEQPHFFLYNPEIG